MPHSPNTPQSRPEGTDPSGFYCYVGPDIRSTLQCNTMFIGTLDEALKKAEKAIKRSPVVRQLIVPGSRLQEARNHIRNDINPEAALYKRILRELKEE